MANPAWPTLVEGVWTKVATNVVTGRIYRLKSNFEFKWTYKLTGGAAPADTAAERAKSPIIFENGNFEEILSNEAIDVYIWPENSDDSVDSSPINSIYVAV